MGNKQEKLEAMMLFEKHDVIANTEPWWDDSQDWNGYQWLSMTTSSSEGTGKEGGEEVREGTECEEMSLKNGHEQDKVRETKARKEALWLVPATGHPIKQSLQMRPSSSGYRRHHNHRLWYHWEISTT